MTAAPGRPRVALVPLLLAVLLAGAGCGSLAPTSARPTASPTPPAPADSAGPPTASTPEPSGAGASPGASAASCARLPTSGVLPANRLVGVSVSTGTDADRLSLQFAASPGPAPVGPARPEALLETAVPPFVHGASGQPLVVGGEQFVRLVMRNMVIVDDGGKPSYDGPTEFQPNGGFIRHVVLSEMFEGVVTWIVGMSAESGCLTLVRSGDGMTLTIAVGR